MSETAEAVEDAQSKLQEKTKTAAQLKLFTDPKPDPPPSIYGPDPVAILGPKCFCGHYSSIHKGGRCHGFVLDDKGILDCDCIGVSR